MPDAPDAPIVTQTDPSPPFTITRPAGGVRVTMARGKVALDVAKRGERPALVVYDFMFQRGQLGRGAAAAVMMLLTLLAVLGPYGLWKWVQRRREARA